MKSILSICFITVNIQSFNRLLITHTCPNVFLVFVFGRLYSIFKHCFCSFYDVLSLRQAYISRDIRTSIFYSFRKSVKTMLLTPRYGC